MEQNLLSIVGIIVQVYATILGIIGMYLVFLRQRTDDQNRDLITRIKIKSSSLVNFINREISPAYENNPTIIVDTQKFDDVIKSIDQYQSDRKKEIPDLGLEDVKRLLLLSTIVQREKEELSQLNAELCERSKKPIISKRSSILFIGYFVSVLFTSFLSILLIYFEHSFQNMFVLLTVTLAIGGLLPLGILFYYIIMKSKEEKNTLP